MAAKKTGFNLFFLTNRHYVGGEGDEEKEGRREQGWAGEEKKQVKNEVERMKKAAVLGMIHMKQIKQRKKKEEKGEKIGREMFARPSGAHPVLSPTIQTW